MHTWKRLRKELLRCEAAIQNCYEWIHIYNEMGWKEAGDRYLRNLHHHLGRRRFVLREILSQQIKEFKKR